MLKKLNSSHDQRSPIRPGHRMTSAGSGASPAYAAPPVGVAVSQVRSHQMISVQATSKPTRKNVKALISTRTVKLAWLVLALTKCFSCLNSPCIRRKDMPVHLRENRYRDGAATKEIYDYFNVTQCDQSPITPDNTSRAFMSRRKKNES